MSSLMLNDMPEEDFRSLMREWIRYYDELMVAGILASTSQLMEGENKFGEYHQTRVQATLEQMHGLVVHGYVDACLNCEQDAGVYREWFEQELSLIRGWT